MTTLAHRKRVLAHLEDGSPAKIAERKVLAFLADYYRSSLDGCFFSFNTISQDTGIDRKAVRRACRSLARKGFARYERALWTDDGTPAGAGYGCTQAGNAENRRLDAEHKERCAKELPK